MLDYQLFLGLPLSAVYQQQLKQLPASLRAVFIQSQPSSYLQQVEEQGSIYLGKYLGPSIEISSLEALQAHVYSLLKKLVPNYPYEQHPLLLLTLSLPQEEVSQPHLFEDASV